MNKNYVKISKSKENRIIENKNDLITSIEPWEKNNNQNDEQFGLDLSQ